LSKGKYVILVLSKVIFIDPDHCQMDSNTLKSFPSSDPEHLEEVVTVTEEKFLPKS